VFYEHFASKEECFFAAVRSGGQTMYRRVADAAGDAERVAEAGTPVHAALRAFLCFLTEEPGFARAFYVGMPSAGTAGLTELDAALGSYVELMAGWHREGLASGEPWPAVDDDGYRVLVDAVVGTASRAVREGRFDTITELEEPLGNLLMAVLVGRAWPQSTRLSPPSTTST
jgi:AcrR family transcriptional regulator